jgi:hypothetical protein
MNARKGKSPMTNIKVGRYSDPVAVGGWSGWIEDAERTWIAFIHYPDGKPVFFLNRDKTGAILDPMPANLPSP